jgi:hypothetical protein
LPPHACAPQNTSAVGPHTQPPKPGFGFNVTAPADKLLCNRHPSGVLTLQRKRTGENQQVTVKHIHQLIE